MQQRRRGVERVKAKMVTIAFFLLTVSLMLGCVAGMRRAVVPREERISTILRLACYANEEHPSTLTAQYFADQVNSRTDGRIRIQVYSAGELGDENSTVEQLGFGGIAFSIINCLSMPDDMILGDARTDVLALDAVELNMLHLEMLSAFEPDYRCIANRELPITQSAQCAGISIGGYTSERLKRLLTKYGFEMVPYNGGDLIGSVHYGYLSGLEIAFMSYVTEGYQQILPYLSFYDGPRSPDVLLASQISMGNLRSEDQKVIRSCAREAAQYQQALLREEQNAAASALREKGVMFYPEEIAKMDAMNWEMLRKRFIGEEQEGPADE